MTTAILAALAAVATVIARLWWGRRSAEKARREAEVKAELAQAEADRQRLQAEADRAVRERQVDAQADGRAVVAAGTEAAARGDAHPERAAAAERMAAQRRAADRVRAKIAAPRRRG